MATAARLPNRTEGHSLANAARSLRLRFDAFRAGARDRSRIARELSTYSDDELSELGFSRADIPAVAAGTYRR